MAARRVRVVEKSDPIDRYVSKTKPISKGNNNLATVIVEARTTATCHRRADRSFSSLASA